MKNEALQQLEIALLNELMEKYPHVPAYAIPHRRRSDKTANGLTQCIIDYIRLHGGQAERIAIMGRPQQMGRQVVWTKSHMTVGTADISATIHGRSVKIEVKIGKDRQSTEQKEYQQQIEQAGGIYYIATDFPTFKKWYESLWTN